jgi:hypothetical protein
MMEALIIHTGTPPGPDGIALWVTMKNSIPILVAGTNSVSSGNIVEESFFDKYFAEKLKVPTII